MEKVKIHINLGKKNKQESPAYSYYILKYFIFTFFNSNNFDELLFNDIMITIIIIKLINLIYLKLFFIRLFSKLIVKILNVNFPFFVIPFELSVVTAYVQ